MDKETMTSYFNQLRALTQLQSQIQTNPDIKLSSIEQKIVFNMLEQNKNQIKSQMDE